MITISGNRVPKGSSAIFLLKAYSWRNIIMKFTLDIGWWVWQQKICLQNQALASRPRLSAWLPRSSYSLKNKSWDTLPVFTACHAIPCFCQEYLSETKLRYLKARTALSSSTLTAFRGTTYWDEPIENWWLTSYITRQEDKPLRTGTVYLPSI